MKKNCLFDGPIKYIHDKNHWRNIMDAAIAEFDRVKSYEDLEEYAHEIESIMEKVPTTEERLQASLILLASKFTELFALKDGLEEAAEILKDHLNNVDENAPVD